MTKQDDEKEMQTLRRKCLYLWKARVKENAGGQCEAWEDNSRPIALERCQSTKFLNAHHIENYVTNKDLRYDPKNGACFCSGHHKFKRHSAHKSFVFMYLHMTCSRPKDLAYLIQNTKVSTPQTKESLLRIINQLSSPPQLLKRIK